jgi:hypothetical protein
MIFSIVAPGSRADPGAGEVGVTPTGLRGEMASCRVRSRGSSGCSAGTQCVRRRRASARATATWAVRETTKDERGCEEAAGVDAALALYDKPGFVGAKTLREETRLSGVENNRSAGRDDGGAVGEDGAVECAQAIV